MFCISDDNIIKNIYIYTQQLNRNLNELLFFFSDRDIVISKLSCFIFFSVKIRNNICTDNQILLFIYLFVCFVFFFFYVYHLKWKHFFGGHYNSAEKNICTFVLTVSFAVLFYLFAVESVNKLNNDILLLYYII